MQLNAERGENILPEVLDMIQGTPLNTGAYLDKLKKMPGSEQSRAATRDLARVKQEGRQALKASKDADAKAKAMDKAVSLITGAMGANLPQLVTALDKAGQGRLAKRLAATAPKSNPEPEGVRRVFAKPAMQGEAPRVMRAAAKVEKDT